MPISATHRPSPEPPAPHVLAGHTDATWHDEIIDRLAGYIAIPALSRAFDPNWKAHGHLDRVAAEAAAWASDRAIDGIEVEVVELEGRTPVVRFEVPAFSGQVGAHEGHGSDDTEREVDTVLLYGHLDKQPPMDGWRPGLGPWTPVIDGDRLYGRGGADDGYAIYASLAAIEAVQASGGRHARCVGIVECSEESGSPDLPAYVEHLADRIGQPTLVVCLDSFCGDYDHLWATTSLRGLVSATLQVTVLTEGVHSGSASGVVPDSFRLARRLLDRIEDADTGRMLLPELHAEIPPGRLDEARSIVAELGPALTASHPYPPGLTTTSTPAVASDAPSPDIAFEQLLAKTWRPTLTITGADGLPPTATAGNVLRPSTTLALSVRLPPTVDADVAARALEAALTRDPPPGAVVTVEVDSAEGGWDAPPTAPWLATALDEASSSTFGRPARRAGEGGSIPFMRMLAVRFPAAQVLLAGVLGPGSNAHGPNEFLHLPTARRVTASVALVLDRHARRHS